MNFSFAKYFSAVIFLFIISSNAGAQTFGFGCLGLSGFYAGFSKEYYDARGINDYFMIINNSPLSSVNQLKLEKGTGYRIGGNLFRAKFSKVFLTAKGFYQFLKENQTTENQSINKISEYQLSLNHWGVGIDFGFNLFWILDFKLLEGGVNFYSGDLTVLNQNTQLNTQSESKFNTEKTKLGYFIGSGLILHIVPDYISIEGTAGYNFIQIDQLKSDSSLPGGPYYINSAIKNGGFSATLQLNIGFPL